ncbi:MAG: S-ribosylhomocysteine lyase [Clostridia bacterium]|nr:S-ribosylhomocysteine lyase [Clostridia bacterium]
MNKPSKIESFKVDHDYIIPGIYVSRRDGDITTYDMRTRRPNMGDYMDDRTMHSVEHMFATFIRSSEIGEQVIYFGPMGCQTGFYLLVRNADDNEVLGVVKKVLAQIIRHDGEMFGASRKECGNYRNLELEDAKRECRAYLSALENSRRIDFTYPTGGEDK